MIQAISAINSQCDPEYLRIIQELIKLGITPSGNKSIDKAKLQQAKEELIQKIQKKEQEYGKKELQVQIIEPAQETQNSHRAELEEQKLGAMTIAELNKLYFGL